MGAPPDQFNQLGQDWSQPPWRPDRLAELGYAPFRDMVRTVLRDSGGIRVDHIIGLFRLWWIPAGGTPADGTYVHYDHEALLGILVLEAQRAGAVVIGEDLGVVGPHVRDYMMRAWPARHLDPVVRVGRRTGPGRRSSTATCACRR